MVSATRKSRENALFFVSLNLDSRTLHTECSSVGRKPGSLQRQPPRHHTFVMYGLHGSCLIELISITMILTIPQLRSPGPTGACVAKFKRPFPIH